MLRTFGEVTTPHLEQEIRRVRNVIAVHEAYQTRLEDELRSRRVAVDIDEKIREVLG